MCEYVMVSSKSPVRHRVTALSGFGLLVRDLLSLSRSLCARDKLYVLFLGQERHTRRKQTYASFRSNSAIR